MDGQRGEKPTNPLFCGRDGWPGEGLIIVKPKTAGGVDKEYRSRYQLELVDFDLEDENADGIFEPGEHLFIWRIRVKNSGKCLQRHTMTMVLILFRGNAFSNSRDSN